MKEGPFCSIITESNRYDSIRCFTLKRVDQWNKEECFNIYTDTAGNYHFTGTITGEHKIQMESKR